MSESEQIFEIEILSLVYGGNGMGRLPDGRAVFVPYVLPGERVLVHVVDDKKRHAIAELLEVLQAAPERIQPRCPHFTECGGCHYQHLTYEHQLEVKTAVLTEQLERIANIVNPPVRPIVPSPAPWNYRNSVQFHISTNGKLGFQGPGSRDVVEVTECHLPQQALLDIWPQLDIEAMPEVERVNLRLGAEDDILMVLESGPQAETPEMEMDLPISVVHSSPAGVVVMAGDDHTIMEVLGRSFKVSADSFFQINQQQSEAMVKHLLAELPLDPGKTLLDVYCGVGLFSAFLAPRVRECIALEVAPSACDDFAVNLDEFENVSLYEGRAEYILPHLELKPDIVLVDPPRAGLAPGALDAIADMQAPCLAYVSCDPSTLARDIKRLTAAGYTLQQVTPFDLFPQTYHVESVVLMSRTCGNK